MLDINLAYTLITFFVLLISLSVHEASHAWSAELLGDATARRLGRLSLNPAVHIDPVGTLLFPLIGLLSGGLVFGWAKPVPVNRSNLKNPARDHLLIAAAGPASNLVQAFLCVVGLRLMTSLLSPASIATNEIVQPFFQMLYLGLILNVILAVFNLFPIPPLDGSWILQGLLPERWAVVFESVRPYSLLLLLAVLMSGVFSRVIGPAVDLARQLAF